ncbi:hypothetical protein PPTG_21752 [Phytophthora nicotianae INRA-310]|uniref:Uncharacterized protein n=2 Tax=Phytophthora nicotianae TaxID=4792 RepID=W2QUK3_PHYN3|nr:hypothetical protein PPTG_21752 [Phytophthora nicotianae INRA-310]ETI32772.1 hypothetical protein F443_20484 [Phytophthora nicotianae P1569]ETN16641.1 hypothetical protein PPTG_21752 [Phytophthora nicotianae INRA-310]
MSALMPNEKVANVAIAVELFPVGAGGRSGLDIISVKNNGVTTDTTVGQYIVKLHEFRPSHKYYMSR